MPVKQMTVYFFNGLTSLCTKFCRKMEVNQAAPNFTKYI